MKRLLVVLLMLCPVALMGQTSKANESFPLTVHVISSKWVLLPTEFGPNSTSAIQIDVSVQGQRYELVAPPDWRAGRGLLAPGDYKARLIKNKHQSPAYELNQSYMLQFPDGKTQQFYLEAVGK